jgi:hypothetical protein
MNTFGTLLNDEVKTLPSSISIVEGQAEFGANAAAKKNIPINLFMAGDILFYNMVIGKEGMSGWWCSYCKLFKNNWQQLGHVCVEAWTIESLTAHAEQIANQEINTEDIRVWAGGAASPPNVTLWEEVLLPGCVVLAVALVVALSAMLAFGAIAEYNRMMMWRLRKLACHRHVVFLPLLENEVEASSNMYWFYRDLQQALH